MAAPKTCIYPGCDETASLEIVSVDHYVAASDNHYCAHHAQLQLPFSWQNPRERITLDDDSAALFNLAFLVIFLQEESHGVYLWDHSHRYMVSIGVGAFEISALRYEVMQIPRARPLTYNAMALILGALGAELQDVLIDEVRENIFHAKLRIRSQGRLSIADVRPSDAFALATVCRVPILLTPDVVSVAMMPD